MLTFFALWELKLKYIANKYTVRNSRKTL